MFYEFLQIEEKNFCVKKDDDMLFKSVLFRTMAQSLATKKAKNKFKLNNSNI